jgi:hypothetical protein
VPPRGDHGDYRLGKAPPFIVGKKLRIGLSHDPSRCILQHSERWPPFHSEGTFFLRHRDAAPRRSPRCRGRKLTVLGQSVDPRHPGAGAVPAYAADSAPAALVHRDRRRARTARSSGARGHVGNGQCIAAMRRLPRDGLSTFCFDVTIYSIDFVVCLLFTYERSLVRSVTYAISPWLLMTIRERLRDRLFSLTRPKFDISKKNKRDL